MSRRSLSKRVILLMAVAILGLSVTSARDTRSTRSLRGTVYYTNNTPSNLDDFPVEVYTRDDKTRVAETTLTGSGEFYFDDLKPGRYLLKLTNPGQCTLTYRVDLRSRSITNVRVVMDAACAHLNGKISDLDVQ